MGTVAPRAVWLDGTPGWDTVPLVRLFMPRWQRETSRLLQDWNYQTVAQSGPWMDLASSVPADRAASWWQTVLEAAGCATPPAPEQQPDADRWRPGGGKIRHVCYTVVCAPCTWATCGGSGPDGGATTSSDRH